MEKIITIQQINDRIEINTYYLQKELNSLCSIIETEFFLSNSKKHRILRKYGRWLQMENNIINDGFKLLQTDMDQFQEDSEDEKEAFMTVFQDLKINTQRMSLVLRNSILLLNFVEYQGKTVKPFHELYESLDANLRFLEQQLSEKSGNK